MMYEELDFRFPFRKYQRMILNQVEKDSKDRRYHISAPPGSGKTIVGLELIRRFKKPAVVFAPTTTIQMQWKEQVGMFQPDKEQVNQYVSLHPHTLKPINIFTYQLISTTNNNRENVEDPALKAWVEDLVQEGRTESEEEAWHRLELLKTNNPRAYSREKSKHYLRTKHRLLREEPESIGKFLHPNALQLIENLIEYGVETVVLDECHHLLDYWALVLRHLISRIENPNVIGLTATLPDPEDEASYENYDSLLGEVDFEVPTPAVVKEGDLAPYRDLVLFVEPTPRENVYLRHIQEAFEDAIHGMVVSDRFMEWAKGSVQNPTDSRGRDLSWEEFLRKRPGFSTAVIRFLVSHGKSLPPDIVIPRDGYHKMTLEDWAALVERFGLDVLKVSADPVDHKGLRRLRKVLHSFGFTLTERGLRQSRSPGDLVLSFSESKDKAAANILAAEHKHMKDRLRAVVVTDFERMSSGVRRLKGVLEKDAGSARRVFKHLARDRQAGKLDPILVTGRGVMVDADLGDALIQRFNRYMEEHNLKARCSYKDTGEKGIREIVGKGRDWSSRTYVRMITEAFEDGVTRCLVGTRGIFGEGWDSLSLNTLIDLTSVTTSTSVQQLRGRSIRKDPDWPRKVAHNWDVICVAPHFDRGNLDLARLLRRHGRIWGIIPLSRISQLLVDVQSSMQSASGTGAVTSASPTESMLSNPLGDSLSGQIVRGLSHISPELSYALTVNEFKNVRYSILNKHMLKQIKRRDQVYDLWKIGEDYSNFSYSTSRIDVRDLKIRTVYSLQDTLKKLLRTFIATFIGILMVYSMNILLSLLDGIEVAEAGGCLTALLISVIGGTMIAFLYNLRTAIKIIKTLLLEQPPDMILLDVGRALLEALRETGAVSRFLQPEYVRVIELPDQSCQVMLDYASPEDAAIFIQAYRDIFEPVRDQRYLIWRTDDRLPAPALRPLWKTLRLFIKKVKLYQSGYHPVPKVLGSRKRDAERFSQAWAKWVGGGDLVYTRTDTGRQILLKARAQQQPEVKSLAFEIWR